MKDRNIRWGESSRSSSEKNPKPNPFTPKDTQSGGSNFDPRSIQEGFKPRFETFEKR